MKTLLAAYQEHKRALLFLFATWGVYFSVLFAGILKFKPDGLYAGHVNVWSDWSLHIAMAGIFAYKDPQYWFAYHPMYAGGKATYPFLSNFISGMLMRAGFSIYFAFIVPSIIYTLLLLFGMYVLFYLVLRSKKQAIFAISSFFLSSGFLGFIKFTRDFSHNLKLDALMHPNSEDFGEYSRLAVYHWYSGNSIIGILLPQRAFLLGMTMSVWIMAGLLYVLLKERPLEKKDLMILVVSGILAGLLPITHAHSFIVVVIVTGLLCTVAGIVCTFSFNDWNKLFYLIYGYVAPAGFISISLYLIFIAGGIENPHFIQWFPGWTAKGGLINWVIMWLKIWGVMIPLAIWGFFLLKRPLIVETFFVGFFALFIISNLILFQPDPWDNSKLFFWAYFGFCGLASVALSWSWHQGRKRISRFDVILLAMALNLTGLVELIGIQIQIIDYNRSLMISRDDINLGLEIRKKTDPLAIFLTVKTSNHLVTLWGLRPILMGPTLWVINYGFSYQQREKDIDIMFKGGSEAEKLLKQYQVSYVVVGPSELHDLHANEGYFSQKYSLAFKNKNYRIYDVRSLWSNQVTTK